MPIVIVTVAILTACGSTDKEDAIAKPPSQHSPPQAEVKTISIDKARYIERVHRFCDWSWRRMLESYARGYGSVLGPDATDAERFAEASKNIILPSLQMQFDDIRYIGARKREKHNVEAILREMQLAVYEGQDNDVSSPAQLEGVFAGFNRLARTFGLSRCLVTADRFD